MKDARANSITVSGIEIEFSPEKGTCSFEELPVAMMWIHSTLAGLFSGVQAMVGTERYLLALQSEGRKSVDADWTVIGQFGEFEQGFSAIANIAAVAGWGNWTLLSLDEENKECRFRVSNSWEGRYQQALGVKWGSAMLAGKMAGYCTKLFGLNCWAEQTSFIAGGDSYDEFIVRPSDRRIEEELRGLLATDKATRADMAVALKALEGEIEERRHAEERQRQSEQRYRALIDTTNTGYVILDGEGRVVDANSEYVRQTGYDSLEQIAGRSILDWTAEMDLQDNTTAFAHCLAEGFIRDYVVHYVNAEGRLTPIEINATVVGTGESRRVLTLCRDISQRLQAERLLQNAQKLESLGVLAGGIAHDFNNMLTGIFGHIELARADLSQGSGAYEHLTNALTVFTRAQALTDQLLTFSKGGAPIKQSISIQVILEECVRFALSGSSVQPHFELPGSLWNCEADAGQLAQVVDNIVINARQAMPLGGSLFVTARNVEPEESLPPHLAAGRYVKISIKDTGIGIQPAILPRIFDPFFTTKQQGSGLGLAAVYSIVKRHSGHISAESEPGKWTEFTLYLPASTRQACKPAATADITPSCGEQRVLFMDDEQSVCDIGSAFLQSMGCAVRCAANGREAVDLYRSALAAGNPFDLVILDLTVPGDMGGRLAMEELMRVDPRAQAIASSGYSNDPVMANPAQYGFKGRLSKPYLRSEFVAVVSRVLAEAERMSRTKN